MTKCTFIHGVEEWLDVPKRLSNRLDTLNSALQNSETVEIPTYRHSGPNWSERFWKVYEILEEEKVQLKGYFKDASAQLVDGSQATTVLSERLKKSRTYLQKINHWKKNGATIFA